MDEAVGTKILITVVLLIGSVPASSAFTPGPAVATDLTDDPPGEDEASPEIVVPGADEPRLAVASTFKDLTRSATTSAPNVGPPVPPDAQKPTPGEHAGQPGGSGVPAWVSSITSHPSPGGVSEATGVGIPAPLCNLFQGDAGSDTDATWANPLALASDTAAGCLDRYDPVDVYHMDATAGESLELTLASPECDGFVMFLFTPAWDDLLGSTFNCGTIDAFAHTDGAYRVVVGLWDWRAANPPPVDPFIIPPQLYLQGSEGVYSITRESGTMETPACFPQDDGASGSDATRTNMPVATSGRTTGCVAPFDDGDYYTVDVPAGEAFTAELSPATCTDGEPDVDLHLYTRDVSTFASISHRASSMNWDCEAEQIEYIPQADDRLVLKVERFSGAGTYNLDIGSSDITQTSCIDGSGDLAQDDAGLGHDANYTNQATLEPGAATGCLNRFDIFDWYRVDVPANQRVSVEITAPTCDDDGPQLHLALYTEDLGSPISFDNLDGCGSAEVEAFAQSTGHGVHSFTLLVASHFPDARLSTTDGRGDYELDRSAPPTPAPQCGAQDDGASGHDASFRHPVLVGDSPADGCVGALDDDYYDIFRVDVDRGDLVTFALETEVEAPQDPTQADPCTGLSLIVLDEDRVPLAYAWLCNGQVTMVPAPQDTHLTVAVVATTWLETPYTLTALNTGSGAVLHPGLGAP